MTEEAQPGDSARIAKIETAMRTDMDAYFKNEPLQNELRSLYERSGPRRDSSQGQEKPDTSLNAIARANPQDAARSLAGPPQDDDQERIAELQSWMSAKEGTPEWRAYWKNGADAELRLLLERSGPGAPQDDEPGSEGTNPDRDLPASPGEYRYDFHGTHEDRTIVDDFAPTAHRAGIGTEKLNSVVTWAINNPNVTEDDFVIHADKQGWSLDQIEMAIKWYRSAKRKFR
jgi:hypothetical protein